MTTRLRKGAWGVWIAVALLAIVHYDFWYWDDRTVLFGFLPIGLAYHASFSIVCAIVWACAVKFAWPNHLEAWADDVETVDDERSS